jgi:hypothetical protein
MFFIETSLNALYKNSVIAFPYTQKRQFAIDTVLIEHLDWVPFLGVKTLFIKATIRNEDKKYESVMLFKNVKYMEKQGKNILPVIASDGKKVFIEQISSEKNDVLVRCSCPDFQYRFNYYNSLDKSLFGKKRKKYEGQNLWKANSKELPGTCKHLIKMAKIMKETKLLI